MRNKFNITSFIWVCLLISSCIEIEPVSTIPEISFLDFSAYIVYNEQLGSYIPVGLIEFDFIDGDADIGVYPEFTFDTSGVIPDSMKYNLILIPQDKIDSSTYLPTNQVGDTISYSILYNEKLDRVGQNKIIKGIIRAEIKFGSIPDYALDTFRYQFFIYDRALQRSNVEYTKDICLKNLMQQQPEN